MISYTRYKTFDETPVRRTVKEDEMANLSKFCTCSELECDFHPTNHDKGCSLCMEENLRTREIPNCFFTLIEGAEKRKGDTFEDFARLILEKDEK